MAIASGELATTATVLPTPMAIAAPARSGCSFAILITSSMEWGSLFVEVVEIRWMFEVEEWMRV